MKLINAGERRIQKQYRIVLRDICTHNDIDEGDTVEVYLKKVKR